MAEPQSIGSRLPSRVVAVGASAGGVSTLIDFVAALPPDLDASILVVLHLSPNAHSALASILARHTQLSVTTAEDNDALEHGHVYVAPPDYHLLADPDRVRVTRGPWENGHRPAIDTLFRSVARWWGARSVGVVLSGALDDGAAGLVAITRAGGVALVQDPREAAVPDMPLAALETGVVEESLGVAELAKRIVELTTPPLPPMATSGSASPLLTVETAEERREIGQERELPPGAQPSGFVCPDCGGALFDVDDHPIRLRCRVGHGWAVESLTDAHSRLFEEALTTALRVLEEDMALQERLASRARAKGHRHTLRRVERRVAERARLLDVLRDVIANRPGDNELEARADDRA